MAIPDEEVETIQKYGRLGQTPQEIRASLVNDGHYAVAIGTIEKYLRLAKPPILIVRKKRKRASRVNRNYEEPKEERERYRQARAPTCGVKGVRCFIHDLLPDQGRGSGKRTSKFYSAEEGDG